MTRPLESGCAGSSVRGLDFGSTMGSAVFKAKNDEWLDCQSLQATCRGVLGQDTDTLTLCASQPVHYKFPNRMNKISVILIIILVLVVCTTLC